MRHRWAMVALTALMTASALVTIPAEAEAACGAGAVCRVAGADRFGTAVAVAQETNGQGAAVVYLAVGTNFPDAVAAGPAAAREDAPILLVQPTGVPTSTMDELRRLDPGLVVIVGGPAAVAESVVTDVAGALPDATVVRRWGADRYETAVALSQGAFAGVVSTVFVASGQDFPDALIAAPAAVTAGAPLLLVNPDGLSSSVADEITRLDPSTVYIVGDVIPAPVATQIGALGPSVVRVGGADRYSTAANLSDLLWPGGSTTVYVARADAYPDALAAGPMTRQANGPLLLVASGSVPQVVRDELNRLDPSKIVVLGGPVAVSTTTAAVLDLGRSSYETAISPGASGPAVEYLQRLLTYFKLYRGPIDGVYPNDARDYPGTMTSAVYAFHKLHESPSGAAWTSGDHVSREWTVADWQRLSSFSVRAPVARSGEPLRFEVDAHHELMWLIVGGEVAAIFHVSVGGEFWYWWSGTGKYELAHTPRGDLDVDHYSLVRYRQPGWMYRAWYYLYTHRWMAMHGYETVPPYPASHGCVRVVWDDADWIYARVGESVGTPFHIWDG